jgi:2,4-diketo-3-deoxy-L-fuconate hydrolase
VPDPHNLTICLTIGSETLQDSNTCNLIFTIPQLIASITEMITLEPGDVILTGTPPGVGSARKPQRFIQPGETVTVEVQGLGTLSNPAVAES